MNDTSTLITIFGSVIPVVKRVFKAHTQRTIQEHIPAHPIKIAVSIDGTAVSIEAPDLESAEAALTVAHRFQAHYPAVASKATPKSQVKVKGTVPKRQGRRRR